MPRILPWLLEQDDMKRVKRESTPQKRVKREPSDTDLTSKNPSSSPNKKDFLRSSQSPPTSPARACPAEEFLIEGLSHDDAWIMVEDEFYAVAQSFTQHLHYAEYLRRKKEIKAQSAEAIRELERPTDGRTTIPKDLQRQKDAETLAARQKAGVEQMLGPADKDDDEDTDTWAGTHLQGFITSPRKMRSLLGARGLKSSTRAAAGFGQAAGTVDGGGLLSTSQSGLPSRAVNAQVIGLDEETASENDSGKMPEASISAINLETASEDDDLDGHHQPTIEQTPRCKETTPPVPPSINRRTQRTSPTSKEKPKPSRASRHSHGYKSRVQSLFDDLDELPEPPQSTPLFERTKSPSNEQTPRAPSQVNNLECKDTRLKDVPTFLM
ncbi:hypothetical protein N7492_006207 [Penicillium capsulatum]|uniref:Uncharacterized protein n=1 Tax=Penicillium capsulatum TaxID=69766 RepID=A0A9W9LMB3_9EURO|nr:hypothetical protein N7492_006207 [Penicillium capsulatum]KAJ6108860.1 hypothetical protein N7512_008697 [Penicillium capsulatum]